MDEVNFPLKREKFEEGIDDLPVSNYCYEIATDKIEDLDVKLEELHHSIDIKEDNDQTLEYEQDNRKKIRKPNKRDYDNNRLDQAIRDIQNKTESYRSAERKYGIPKSTIQYKIKHPEHKSTCGPSPILSEDEEETLVKWVKNVARKGFPRKAIDLKSSVQNFLNKNPRKNPFKNNRPGDGWMKAFLKRHPDISEKMSEPVSSASACVSEKDIRHWFSEINDYIKEKKLEDVLADPSRVFNGDESGFKICPATGKVFAQGDSKNVNTVDKGSSKENITVMFTFSANGNICVPMVIYPYQRIPEKIVKSINPQWGVGRSDNGWMTSETFYEYVANVFHPHLVQNNIKFPIILFLDGHKSQLSYSLSVLCNELQIELFALYPNATKILQPCDFSGFRPLEEAWRRTVKDWEEENPEKILKKVTFAPLLEKAIQCSVKPETLINGFKACGIHSFDPDQIDYSKCLGGAKNNPSEDSLFPDANTMKYSTFVDIVGQTKIEQFAKLNEALPDDIDDNFLDLFKIWTYYNNKTKSLNPNRKATNKVTINSNIVVNAAPILPIKYLNPSSGKTLEDDGNKAPSSPKSYHISPKANSSKTAESEMLGNFLISPETPKRNTERFPLTITSKKYRMKRKPKEQQGREKRKRKCKEKNLKCDDTKNVKKPKKAIKRNERSKETFDEDEDEIYLCHHCNKEDDSES